MNCLGILISMILLLENLKPKISFKSISLQLLLMERIFLRKVPKKFVIKGALHSKKPSLLVALYCVDSFSLPLVPAPYCQHCLLLENPVHCQFWTFTEFIWTLVSKKEKEEKTKTFFLCCTSHCRLWRQRRRPRKTLECWSCLSQVRVLR